MTSFQERLQRLRQEREGQSLLSDLDTLAAQRQSRALQAFRPALRLLASLRQLGVTFPAGPPPPLPDLEAMAAAQPEPRVQIPLSTRYTLYVWITPGLHFGGCVRAFATTSHRLIPGQLTELEEWLANIVSEFEVQSPSGRTPLAPEAQQEVEPEGRTRVIDLE